ncbi:NAD(P)H-hydrate dehydratase [Bacillus gobiensis]|uniref:NAD(P)H-hydrate dehydratase n=1 Tax=Bacillus gobiensis TaxID=1441095 RepID=UPI003D20371F
MRIVSADEMYCIDSYTTNQIGISGETLMENAGQSIARLIMERTDPNQKIVILAGAGNNGGDGFVIARILKSFDFQVDLWTVPPYEKIKGAAKHALEVYKNSGYEALYFLENEEHFFNLLSTYDVIIDCLLGIGVKGELRSPYKEIIDKINTCKSAEIFSIDVPSGVPADGCDVDRAVRADLTITIHLPKSGAFIYPCASYYGETIVADIGIPPIAAKHCSHNRMIWTDKLVKKHLPSRSPNSHKGSNGKGKVIGGSREMTGAIMLAAKAALRCGAGLITAAIPEEIHPIAAAHFLEAMYLPSPSEDGYFKGNLSVEYENLDAVAVGPGIGRTKGGKLIVEEVITKELPVVIDADALYHLKDMLPLLKNRKHPTILTPHPGEMARLIDKSIKEVEQDRFSISRLFAKEYGIYLVIKGPFTIVTTPGGEQFVNTTGNSALAKGGTGDALTGMILAFIMQQTHVQSAISNAVFVHGKSADVLIEQEHTHFDVLSTDLIENIPRTLKLLT